jgi:Tol biopolymer transport system component
VLWVDGSDTEPRLVFCAKELVNNKNHIFAVNEDGSGLAQLTFDEEGVTCPGSKVATKLVGASMPSFSPDGMMIAFNVYLREINTNYAHNAVCLMDNGGGSKTVIFDVQKEETHYRDICWSMDGQFVIFSYENNGRRVMAIHVSSLAQSEFTTQMEVGGTAVENLWTSPIENKIVYNIHVPGGGSLYMVTYTTAGSTAAISGTYTQLNDAVAVGHGYAEPDWQKWDGK